jgi:predicted lipid-binding transport protein (Tim44 family)
MTRRRIAILALLAIALGLILAPTALAAAGGGSSGFSGGGGGGGGGRGAGLYILIQILIRIAIFGHGLGALFLIGLIVLALLFTNLAPRVRNFWAAQESSGRPARRRAAQRQRRVELAAAEAAEDDPVFAPDVVRPAAAKLFTEIQAAWDANDRIRLRGLVAADLLAEWERRLDDFERKGWRNRVQPLEHPKIEYVGLRHGSSANSDRVVVRVEAKLRDYVEDRYGQRIKRVGRLTETVRVREFWTLGRQQDDSGAAHSGEAGGRAGGKPEGHWILVSIEQGAEGAHALEEQIVATPWSDDQAMRDEALVEGAVAEAVPEGTKIAEVADLDFQGDARAAALDLSLADGRFAPDVLEIAARRAVAAWAESVDGADGALLAIAHPGAAQQLLYPGDPSQRTRLVVRGPRVRQIRITALDAAATPPTMSIEVDLEGRRYLEERDTAAVVAGSQSRKTSFTEHWTLVLDGDASQPWRIAAVGMPVGRR